MSRQQISDERHPMKWLILAGLVLVAILASFIWYLLFLLTGEGELAEKPVVTMLQGLAMDATGNRQTGPILRTGAGHYVALGVPGTGNPSEDQGSSPASTRMWVILNEHSASATIRRINAYSGYDLGCTYVDRLRATVPDVDNYVVEYLRTICR